MVGQFANWSLRQFVFYCKKRYLPLGVVGKGPCQVVEGVGGGPEGDATQAQADQSKGHSCPYGYNPLQKGNSKALLYKNFLKIKSLQSI
ncbi:hypothetical protein HMPREF1864_00912 [Peptoniphilus sp. DNF00840]|nr:hypothetical protein HMPREF1864_00912 [Peptoniphilus sp. DNF00840]